MTFPEFLRAQVAKMRAIEPKPFEQTAIEKSREPIVGYRVWKLKVLDAKIDLTPTVYNPAGMDISIGGRRTATLTSANQETEWPFRKALERDEIRNMGIHAVKDGSYVEHLWHSYSADVAGSVYLWGEVKEHTQGYLAEFAYPKELWMPEATDPLLIMELEENYGITVKLRADLVKHEPMPIQQFPASACQGTYGHTVAANAAMYYPNFSAAAYAQMQQNAMAAQQAQMQAMTNAQLDILMYATQPKMLKPGSIVSVQSDGIVPLP